MGRRLLGNIWLYILLLEITIGASFAPEIFYVDLNKPKTYELTVINESNKQERYKVSVVSPTDEDWEMIPEEWVRFYPKIVSLAPQSNSVVRFRVNAPSDIEEKEYLAHILLEEMEGEKYSMSDSNEEGVTAGLGYTFSYQLPIYGQKGEAIHEGRVYNLNILLGNEEKLRNYYGEEAWETERSGEEFSLKNLMWYSLKVINQGNSSLRAIMKVTYFDKKGDKLTVAEKPLGVIAKEQNFEGVLSSVPKEVEKINIEIFHYNLIDQSNRLIIFNNDYSL